VSNLRDFKITAQKFWDFQSQCLYGSSPSEANLARETVLEGNLRAPNSKQESREKVSSSSQSHCSTSMKKINLKNKHRTLTY
jgi:hypothetical protein